MIRQKQNMPGKRGRHSRFLYHAAIFERLALVGRNGLTTPRKHGFETDYGMPFYSKDFPDRLFLWGGENAALEWASDMGLVALRFTEEALGEAKLVPDKAFPGARRRTHPSYYVDATVPAAFLEACEEVKQNGRVQLVAVSWMPLKSVKGPTHRIDIDSPGLA